MRSLYALPLLVLAPVLLTAAPSQKSPADWPFVVPTETMVIPASNQTDGGGWTLNQLLLSYGSVTDTAFIWDADTRQQLATTTVPIEQDVTVAPENLHKIVETLLIESDFVITLENKSNPLLVTVHSLRTTRGLRGTVVPAEELNLWEDHPAHVIETVITANHLDTRMLTNSLRAILTDANTMTIIPMADSHSMILTGSASHVLDLSRLIGLADENARIEHESRPKEPEPTQGEADTTEEQ